MILPLQITFRNMGPSDAVEAAVRKRASHLDRYFGRIVGCRVTVEAPHQHHRKGKHYRIRIDLTVPGAEIVVGADPTQAGAHEDVYVALRDAFRAARRLLEDHARRARGDVKLPSRQQRGHVSQMFPDQHYGFVRADDGRDVYFHFNSVIQGFERIDVGSPVRFTEEEGVQGPQASAVYLASAHRRGRSRVPANVPG